MSQRICAFLRPILFVFAVLFSRSDAFSQAISPYIFGQNAWMPDTIGSNVLGGKLHTKWGRVSESGAKMVRFGGITADRDLPTKFQYIKMIDSIRARGMEPIIQVSYYDGAYTAAQAAQLVQYINVTKGKNVKYWSIGNEPDLEYGYTTASQVAAYIKPFASAMKAVDPSIKIIGPETAWYNQSIIHGLTTPGGANDITGTDTAGRYYVDIISFHTYPFNGSQTRNQLINKLTASPGFDSYLGTLSARVASCNVAHSRTGSNALKTAVTELNVNYQNSSTDNVNGTGVNSFVGAQFVAEMLGLGMKHSVNIMTMWSVIEGNSTALNIGYLDRTTGAKKPVYHHFQMMSEHFAGNYVGSTSTQTNVKVFSAQSSSLTTVLIMNQDTSTNYSYAVRLNTAAITATNALKINVNANIAQNYYNVIPNQSSVLLQFDNQGAIVKKVTYTIVQALAGGTPTVSVYTPSTTPLVTQPVITTPASQLTVCSGNSTSLTAVSGTNTIKWYGSATSSVVLHTGSVYPTPTLATAGSVSLATYYAEASANSAVSARSPVTVTVNPRPTIAVNSGSVCAGKSFTLVASGAATYSYSGGSAIVTPSASTAYSVSGTSAAGCSAAAAAIAQVSVVNRPVISVSNGTVCAGTIFTLAPSGASSYTYSGGAAAVMPASTTSYTISGSNTQGCVSLPVTVQVSVLAAPSIAVNSGSICAGDVFTLNPSSSSAYTISGGSATVSPISNSSYTVSAANGQCVSYAVANVTVHARPAVTANSGAICQGKNFTISPTGASSYNFSGGNAVVSPNVTTNYSVTGTSAAGCTSSVTIVTVTVNPVPAVSVNSGSVCAGSSFSIVPSGAANYSISGASFVVTPMTSSSYTVTGSNQSGCSSSVVSHVTVVAKPVISIAGGSICKGSSFTLSPSGAGSYTYSSGSAIVSPSATTSYTVWGSLNGCTSNPALAAVTVITKKSCNTGKLTTIVPNMQPTPGATLSIPTETLYVIETNTATAAGPANTTDDTAAITGLTEGHEALIASAFPNPNAGEFSIRVNTESEYSLLNLAGYELRRGVLAAGITPMNISDLPPAIYFVRISRGNEVQVIRVLKQ